MWLSSKVRIKHFWFSPSRLSLITTAYQDHIWWTWFHVTFVEGLLTYFWLSLNKLYFINATHHMKIFLRCPIRPCLINTSYQRVIIVFLSPTLWEGNCKSSWKTWSKSSTSREPNFAKWKKKRRRFARTKVRE